MVTVDAKTFVMTLYASLLATTFGAIEVSKRGKGAAVISHEYIRPVEAKDIATDGDARMTDYRPLYGGFGRTDSAIPGIVHQYLDIARDVSTDNSAINVHNIRGLAMRGAKNAMAHIDPADTLSRGPSMPSPATILGQIRIDSEGNMTDPNGNDPDPQFVEWYNMLVDMAADIQRLAAQLQNVWEAAETKTDDDGKEHKILISQKHRLSVITKILVLIKYWNDWVTIGHLTKEARRNRTKTAGRPKLSDKIAEQKAELDATNAKLQAANEAVYQQYLLIPAEARSAVMPAYTAEQREYIESREAETNESA